MSVNPSFEMAGAVASACDAQTSRTERSHCQSQETSARLEGAAASAGARALRGVRARAPHLQDACAQRCIARDAEQRRPGNHRRVAPRESARARCDDLADEVRGLGALGGCEQARAAALRHEPAGRRFVTRTWRRVLLARVRHEQLLQPRARPARTAHHDDELSGGLRLLLPLLLLLLLLPLAVRARAARRLGSLRRLRGE